MEKILVNDEAVRILKDGGRAYWYWPGIRL
jgi:hypothetical protein